MVFNCKLFGMKAGSEQQAGATVDLPPLTPTTPTPMMPLPPMITGFPAAGTYSQPHVHVDIESGRFPTYQKSSCQCSKDYLNQASWTHPVPVSHVHHHHTPSNSHTRIYVSMALLFIFILSVNTLLLLLWPHLTSDDSHSFSCVECDSLKLSSDPMDDYSEGFDRKLVDNVWICCASNATQQQKLFEVYVERSLRNTWAADSPHHALAHSAPAPHDTRPRYEEFDGAANSLYHNDTTAPPVENPFAAHLFLQDQHFSQTEDLTIIRGWADPLGPGELNFVRQGIIYDHGSGKFTITRSGLYNVYSHLVYKGIGTNSHLFQQVIAREQSGLSAPAGPQPLLEDAEWVSCDPLQTLPCYTSHLSSQLYLKKGDQVFVYAKPVHALKADRRSSFFGLYYISG